MIDNNDILIYLQVIRKMQGKVSASNKKIGKRRVRKCVTLVILYKVIICFYAISVADKTFSMLTPEQERRLPAI